MEIKFNEWIEASEDSRPMFKECLDSDPFKISVRTEDGSESKYIGEWPSGTVTHFMVTDEVWSVDNKILVLDIETTNFQNAGGSIVEIGAVELNLITGEIVPVFDSLCREPIFSDEHCSGKFGWIFSNSDMTPYMVKTASPFQVVKARFQRIINRYPLGVTAFNRNFDLPFLESRGLVFTKKLPCPMLLSTDVLKLPSPRGRGYKWPKVEEAMKFFFPDEQYSEAHRGCSDAADEARIVYELYKLGIFKID